MAASLTFKDKITEQVSSFYIEKKSEAWEIARILMNNDVISEVKVVVIDE